MALDIFAKLGEHPQQGDYKDLPTTLRYLAMAAYNARETWDGLRDAADRAANNGQDTYRALRELERNTWDIWQGVEMLAARIQREAADNPSRLEWWKCQDCGREFQLTPPVPDTAIIECPSCHGPLKNVGD